MPTQYQLNGSSLQQIQQQATELYGENAQIMKAEKVRTGGIIGFFSKEHFEAVIQIPETGKREPKVEEPSAGRSLHQLLELADRQEQGLASAQAMDPVSRQNSAGQSSASFSKELEAQVIALVPDASQHAGLVGAEEEIEAELARENAHFRDRVRVLPPAAVGGQQVLVVGLGRDALDASVVLDHGSALRRNAGELAQLIDPNPVSRKPLNDRQGTLRARAAAVEQQRTLLVSLSLTFAQPLDAQLQLISQLQPDQLWVAVDVSRKAEDTAQWVSQVVAVHPVSAVLALNADLTSSAQSVTELGYPVRWAEH